MVAAREEPRATSGVARRATGSSGALRGRARAGRLSATGSARGFLVTIANLPAPAAEHPRPRREDLWRSPIAMLPLWPLAATALILYSVASLLHTALSSQSWWRGLDMLIPQILLLWWWWNISRKRGHSLRDVLGPAPQLWHWLLMLVTILLVQCLRLGWLTSLVALDGVPEYWKSASSSAPPEAALGPAEFLAVIIVGPCAEEIAFRGLLFRRYLRRMRPVLAALCSSLLFGLFHFDIVGSLLVGLTLVGLYIRSGSLWLCIAAHGLCNATAGVVAELIEARASLGWLIAAAQLLCVPWFCWFVLGSLRRVQDGPEDGRRTAT